MFLFFFFAWVIPSMHYNKAKVFNRGRGGWVLLQGDPFNLEEKSWKLFLAIPEIYRIKFYT